MERVGLDFETFKDRPTFALSGGERRRVGLAGVLALRPALLALDEPTSGLDPAGRARILCMLHDLRREGTTLVAATHIMEEAAELSDRVTVMSRGRTVLSGSPADVFAGPLEDWGLSRPPALAFLELLEGRGVRLDDAARSGRMGDLVGAIARALPDGRRG
jgi:energy-coupling factor transport system ATP-binding protein